MFTKAKQIIKPVPVILMASVFGFIACGGSGGGSDDAGAGTTIGSTGAATASVSGTVSASVTTFNVSNGYMFASNTAGACAGASFSVFQVGGGGSAIASGTASSDGSFATPSVASTDEVVIEFTCGSTTQKCFGKPGESALVCDPLSHAIVAALDAELGDTGIKNNTLYKGVSLSSIAAGMTETLRLMAKIDSSSDLSSQITTAMQSNDSTTLKSIISNSAVGSMFSTLGAMAKEKKAYNEQIAAGQTEDQALATAAATGWNVEQIVNFLVGLGVEINVAVDPSDGPHLYSPLMMGDGGDLEGIDAWTGLDYNTKLRQFLYEKYTAQYTNKTPHPVSLACVAEPDNWDQKNLVYAPGITTQNGDTTALTCNTAAMATSLAAGTCVNNTVMDPVSCTGTGESWNFQKMQCEKTDKTNETDCQTASGEWRKTYRWVTARLYPSETEANRNDPTGKYKKDKINIDMSDLEVYDEFMAYFMTGPTECQNSVDFGAGQIPKPGSELVFNNCVKNAGLNKYFAGMFGVYKFMRNATLKAQRFSLNDIYTAFTDKMRMGLMVDTWQMGAYPDYVRLNATDATEDSEVHYPAYNLKDSGTTDANGNARFELVCPENVSGVPNLCSGGTPVDTMSSPLSVTTADVEALAAYLKPGYLSTFSQFENIPPLDQLKSMIFNDKHHESWNITGSKYFYVSRADTDPDSPVLCKINNPDTAGSFVPGTSSISCSVASGTWTNGKPDATAQTWITTNKYHYYLEPRDSQKDDDSIYALVKASNGQEVHVNGQMFRIRGVKSDHASIASMPAIGAEGSLDLSSLTAGNSSTDLYNVQKTFCDTWQDSSGSTQQQCWQEQFNYTPMKIDSTWYASPGYRPYEIEANVFNPDTGEDYWFNVAMVDMGNDNNPEGDFAVCIKDAGVTQTNGAITSQPTLNGNLTNCFDSNNTGNFYYLRLEYEQPSPVAGSYVYSLVRNDGMSLFDATPFCAGGSSTGSEMNASECTGVGGTWTAKCSGGSASGDETDRYACWSAGGSWASAALVTQTTLNSGVNNDFGAGHATGPGIALSFMPDYQMANPAYAPEFDPYCIADGTGTACRTKVVNSVTVIDTLSEPPVWPGDPSFGVFEQLNEGCGGDSGLTLGTCLSGAVSTYGSQYDISMINFDDRKWFECLDGTAPHWVDREKLKATSGVDNDTSGVDDYQEAGGCGTNGTPSAIRMRKLIMRDNAYDIERPETVMKLISASTRSLSAANDRDTTKPGITIAATDTLFSFEDALALVLLRIQLPPQVSIEYESQIREAPVWFEELRVPGSHGDPVSGLLRAFLEKSGAL